jgi:hypothetical protein
MDGKVNYAPQSTTDRMTQGSAMQSALQSSGSVNTNCQVDVSAAGDAVLLLLEEENAE